jgi:hypothetical protein
MSLARAAAVEQGTRTGWDRFVAMSNGPDNVLAIGYTRLLPAGLE